MDRSLWADGHLRADAMLRRYDADGEARHWRFICGDFSCLMFFCIKYLDTIQIAEWVPSVFRISCPHWRAQLMIWLIESRGMLTGAIKQPSEFPEPPVADVSPIWSWSHIIDGEYFEKDRTGYAVIDFISSENLAAFNAAVASEISEALVIDWKRSFARYEHLASRLPDFTERFRSLYIAK
jgi:hypothetical protein